MAREMKCQQCSSSLPSLLPVRPTFVYCSQGAKIWRNLRPWNIHAKGKNLFRLLVAVTIGGGGDKPLRKNFYTRSKGKKAIRLHFRQSAKFGSGIKLFWMPSTAGGYSCRCYCWIMKHRKISATANATKGASGAWIENGADNFRPGEAQKNFWCTLLYPTFESRAQSGMSRNKESWERTQK